MGAVSKVIVRVLVVEFYKQNAAFFGLLILVFFGFVRGEEHLEIGRFLVSYPPSLFYLYGIWLSYLVKIFLFTGPAIFKPENSFLHAFSLLPVAKKIYPVLVSACLLFAPAVFYAMFLIYLTFTGGSGGAAVSLLIALILFTGLIALFLYRKLFLLPHEQTILRFRFASKFARPAWLFFAEHMLRNEPVLLFLTKAYSCLLIVGASLLYETDTYDLRLFTTGVLLAFSGNIALLNKYTLFYYHKLHLTRNLPLTETEILFFHFVAVSVVLMPEFLFLINYFPMPFGWIEIGGLILFGSGICLLTFAGTLLKNADMEKNLVWMFWLIVGTTFLILFSIHPMALGILFMVIFGFVLRNQHFKFEFTE